MFTAPAARRLSLGFLGLATICVGCEPAKPPPAAPASQPGPALAAASGPTRPLGLPTGTFLDRDDPNVLRLVTYNVDWNSIFPDVNQPRADKFARVIAALYPDVLALQEIGTHPNERERTRTGVRTADDVLKLMNVIAPLPGGLSWQAFQGQDDVIVSKYPLSMTGTRLDPAGDRELAMALINLPDAQFTFDLYLLNNHYKCCDAEQNDPRRQKQSDALMAWIRDARTPGGHIDLPPGTAIVIAGDLNIIGGFHPVETLVSGDISDEVTYGPDYEPDWDDSSLTDAHPLHNVVGPDDWTWRDDNGKFKPGRLDYVIYTDSVLEAVKKFSLDTTMMSDADLDATGLRKFDVTQDDYGRDYDHLPLVVDFRTQRAPAATPAASAPAATTPASAPGQ